MPMEVPSPPLSLMIAVVRSACTAVSWSISTSDRDGMSKGSIEDSGTMPVAPLSTSA